MLRVKFEAGTQEAYTESYKCYSMCPLRSATNINYGNDINCLLGYDVIQSRKYEGLPMFQWNILSPSSERQ
jgi:hypothetical protein